MLQDLSYPDFKHFLESNFRDNDRFAELETWKSEYSSQLLEAVAQKAAGVSLWVHLVVRSLLAGLVNGDRVSDMQRRLDFLPPDLEKLYERILKNLDPFYREHTFYISKLSELHGSHLVSYAYPLQMRDPNSYSISKYSLSTKRRKSARAELNEKTIEQSL